MLHSSQLNVAVHISVMLDIRRLAKSYNVLHRSWVRPYIRQHEPPPRVIMYCIGHGSDHTSDSMSLPMQIVLATSSYASQHLLWSVLMTLSYSLHLQWMMLASCWHLQMITATSFPLQVTTVCLYFCCNCTFNAPRMCMKTTYSSTVCP